LVGVINSNHVSEMHMAVLRLAVAI